jgi:hypothetical protein
VAVLVAFRSESHVADGGCLLFDTGNVGSNLD